MQALDVRFEARERELEVHGPGGVDDVGDRGTDFGVCGFVETEDWVAEIAGQGGGFRGVQVEVAVCKGVADA